MAPSFLRAGGDVGGGSGAGDGASAPLRHGGGRALLPLGFGIFTVVVEVVAGLKTILSLALAGGIVPSSCGRHRDLRGMRCAEGGKRKAERSYEEGVRPMHGEALRW